MSSRCKFSTHCASIASASLSLTIRTGTLSSSASFAALRRRAPAITSYLLSSSSRTKSGARTPWVIKLAASSLRPFSSKRLRGLLGDSMRAAKETSRYSLLFCFVVCIVTFSFLISVFELQCLCLTESERDALSGGLDRWQRTVRDEIRLRITRVGFLRLFGLPGNRSHDYGCGL